jgi:hypothetical protein
MRQKVSGGETMAVRGSVPRSGVIVPHVVVRDAAGAVDFYVRAFAAKVLDQRSVRACAGTWQAKTGEGSAAKAMGSYTFAKELKGHVLARHSSVAGCQGPEAFDCEHGDLLYVLEKAPGQPLKAIYFDNEGHVIHYTLSTPDAKTVIFLSEPGPGPRFNLSYHLESAVMSGKFQMQMPGREDWKSYLEWSGGKQ